MDRKILAWAVVLAQLEGRSLPTPKFRGSNPKLAKLIYQLYFKKKGQK